MNSKGYIYTVVSVILALLLLLVMSLYYDSFKVSSQVSPTKIRTDELHYFVESTQKDLTRAMVITGRRGAIYLADHAISTNTTLTDAQSALKSLIVNGSLRNASGLVENITYMENHSLSVWLGGVKSLGDDLGFDVNITFVSVDIYQYDAWNFLEVITLNYNLSDKRGSRGPMCSYENPSLRLYSLVSTSGVEDVLYPMNTANKIRRILIEDTTASADTLIATGLNGSGIGGGVAYDLSALSDPSAAIIAYDENYTNFGQEHPPSKYAVFVLNVTNYNLLSAAAREIINASSGVINYNNLNLTGRGFPYVSGITYVNFSQNKYVALKSGAQNQVLRLEAVSDLSAKTYRNTSAGPGFFDRLEGRPNLSEKYVNQSRDARAIFGLGPEENLGIESYANVSEFAYYKLYETGYLPGFDEESTVDHAYFKGETGTWIYGTPEWFRLGEDHTSLYGLTLYEEDPDRILYLDFEEGAGAAYYGFNRSTTYAAAAVNGSGWTEGVDGLAASFDGADDYARIETSSGVTFTNLQGDFSIDLWFKGAYNGSQKQLFSKRRPAYLYVNYTNLTAGVFTTAWFWVVGPAPVNDTWHHVAYTWENSTQNLSLYLDGNLSASAAGLGVINALYDDPLFLGAEMDPPRRFFNGSIDELRITSRTLTAEEIANYYESRT